MVQSTTEGKAGIGPASATAGASTQPPVPAISLPPWVAIAAVLVALALGLAVVMIPGLVYTPAQKVVTFFMLGMCPAILLADRAAAQFEMKLPGMVFTAGGAAAILFGALFMLDRFAKPEQQIAVFDVQDDQGHAFPLEAADLKVHPDGSTGLVPTRFIDGSTLILIFPQQVPVVNLSLTLPLQNKTYRGSVAYGGNKTFDLVVGKDLK